MSKATRTILCVCTALYVGLVIWTIAERNTAQNEAEQAQRALLTAIGERNNAVELAKQYKAEYQQALFEIAELKEQNEELTRAFEETSFALDEVCYETEWDSLGEFKLTFYCPCQKCCGKYANGITATGTEAKEGRTIAVDPDIIPLGSKVEIGGHFYTAEDTGVHGRVIDIFVNDHYKALELGTYTAEVKRCFKATQIPLDNTTKP